jgi:hypothetical protein
MNRDLPRRRLLKVMLGAGGAAAATRLPERWMKPVVEATLLPAHAQTSSDEIPEDTPAGPEPCIDDLVAVLTWTEAVDLDLSMRLPGGGLITPGGSSGPHSISADVTDAPGGETAFIPCGEASNPENDRYQLFVRNNDANASAAFSVSIDTPAQSVTINCASLAPDTGVRIAYVDYSGGQGGIVELAANPASCSLF